jgi:NUMOD3 motif
MKNNSLRLGKLHSEETKKKIRDAAIKRWSNKSERKKQSIAMQGDNNPMNGKHHTLESKIKMSQALRTKRLQNNGYQKTE